APGGWGARWPGAPPPTGSSHTHTTQPTPSPRAHTASGPPPPDAPRLPANRPPRHLRVRAAARLQVWKQQRNGDERPAAPLGNPARPSADGRVGSRAPSPPLDRRVSMTLLIVLALLIALALAAWRWGHDSRDDQDWKT